MNKVIMIGNIATDIEMRTTQSGVANCSFRIAVQRKFKNANGEYESDFLSVVAWRQTAEFIHKYFSKGSKIAIEGSLQARSYDAQDGSKRYVTEIVADQAEFVAPRKDDAQPSKPSNEGFTEVDDNELPF